MDPFSRQYNCLTEPEKQLTFGFLLLSLDPLTPGMPVAAYDLAWAAAGLSGSIQEAIYREAYALQNVSVGELEFVVPSAWGWFYAWAAAIADEKTNVSLPCPCDSF